MYKSISSRGKSSRRSGSHSSKKQRFARRHPSRTLRCEPLEDRTLLSAYFVSSSAGNDAWDGTHEVYISGNQGPWKTLDKVNNFALQPGDSVSLARGDTWRESLIPKNGSSSGNIVYADYGDITKPKPLLLGSSERNDEADWLPTGSNNVWTTKSPFITTELLPNPNFDGGVTTPWSVPTPTGGAIVTSNGLDSDADTAPYSYQITCGNNNGTASSNIRLLTTGVSIVSGKRYQLTFRAKCDQAFTLPTSGVGLAGTTLLSTTMPTITTEWQTYTFLFRANTTNSNAPLTFYLGNALPENHKFNIDTLSLKEELLPNPSFDNSGTSYWTLAKSGGATGTFARTTTAGQYDSPGGGGKLSGVTNNGTAADSIQLYTAGNSSTTYINVTAGSYYLLTFRAKSGQLFHMPSFDLKKSASPYTVISTQMGEPSIMHADTWTTYAVLLKATTTWTNCRLTIYLGNAIPDVIPEGENNTFYIDTVSLKPCTLDGTQRLLSDDVGNIIFNNGVDLTAAPCGVKRWSLENGPPHTVPPYEQEYDCYNLGLNNKGDFYYDYGDWTVKLRTDGSSPANTWSDTEIALKTNGVSLYSVSYATFQNLDIRYCGGDSIVGTDPHNVTIRDCDMSFNGGAFLFTEDGEPVRVGNGVTLFGSVHDIIVERCKMWQIYDVAFSIEWNYAGAPATVSNINFRNNLIGYCDGGWNYYTECSTSVVSDIYCDNNTFVYSGRGWSDAQRPYSYGWDVNFMRTTATTISNICVRNNIFYGSSEEAIWICPGGWPDNLRANLTMDYNLYYSDEGYIAKNANAGLGENCVWYSYDEFNAWKNDTGKDANSQVVIPQFVDDTGSYRDPSSAFRLRSTSPAIDAGVDTGFGAYGDFGRNARQVGAAYDIGAFEYDYIPNTAGLLAYWRLDETSNPVHDSYGKNEGVNEGATTDLPGQVNTCYSFNNSSGEVDLPRINYDSLTPSISAYDGLTLSAWFKKSSNDSTNADAIFDAYHFDNNTQLKEGYSLRFDPGAPGTLRFDAVTKDGDGTRTPGTCYSPTLSTGEWHYVAATYDKYTGKQVLYVDGVAVDTEDHPAGNTIVPLTAESDMHIGYSHVNSGFFNGSIDEVKVFDRALTKQEVDADYLSGNLVGLWNMEEKQGTTAYDQSPVGNDGTNHGPAELQLAGQVNNCYQFGGSEDYVSIPRQNSDEITVSAWFYRQNNSSTQTIFSAYASAAHEEGYMLSFYGSGSNTLRFYLVTQTSGGAQTPGECAYTFSGGSVGTWHQVVGTYDKVYGTQTLYVDGVAVAFADHPDGNTIVPLTYDANMYIGYSTYYGGGYFNGKIDEVKLFSRPLTSDQVAADYLNGNLAGYWALEELGGEIARDWSPRGADARNHGALIHQSGIVGACYSFDDANSEYIAVPAMNYDQLSVSAWFYKDCNDTSDDDTIFGGYASGQSDEGYMLRFYSGDPDTLRFELVTQDGEETRTFGECLYHFGENPGDSTLAWHHVVGTYDKTTHTQTLYVDGAVVDAADHPEGNTVVPLTLYSTMKIGGSQYGNGGYFDGRIDEVKVFDVPLTADQVASEYNHEGVGMGLRMASVVPSEAIDDTTVLSSRIAAMQASNFQTLTAETGDGLLVGTPVSLFQDGKTTRKPTRIDGETGLRSSKRSAGLVDTTDADDFFRLYGDNDAESVDVVHLTTPIEEALDWKQYKL